MSQAVETLSSIETPTTTPTKPMQLDLPWGEQDAVNARPAEVATCRRPSSAPVSREPGVRSFLTFPTVFVLAPRAVASRYAHQPWADILEAAERGVDGLAVVTERPSIWGGRQGERPPVVPDVAFLAEGQNEWCGRTVLYQQNW